MKRSVEFKICVPQLRQEMVLQNNFSNEKNENSCTGSYMCRAREGTKSIVNNSIFMFEIIATEGIFSTNIYIGFTSKHTGNNFVLRENFLLSLIDGNFRMGSNVIQGYTSKVKKNSAIKCYLD